MIPATRLLTAVAAAAALSAALPSAWAGATLDRIHQTKVMKVATAANWPPQSFLGEDNQLRGFDIDVAIIHPDGVSELYLGQVNGPRMDLATDAVVRTAGAKEYSAATRLYGLVEGHLLWAWDIAALGQELRTHASARLAKVD